MKPLGLNETGEITDAEEFKSCVGSNENFCGIGTPKLTLRDQNGTIISEYENHNHIVRVGRSALIRILGGFFGTTAVRIDRCAVGTGGVGTDPWVPIAPLDNDTALYNEVAGSRKNVDSITYGAGANPTEMTITTLFTSEAVNAIVSEAGLYLNNGAQTLFARYTFPSMYLRNDKGYSLEIAWNIKFS